MSYTCPHCGASLQSSSIYCNYCNGKLPIRATIPQTEKENLNKYIEGLEKILESKKNSHDGRVSLFFFVMFLAWVGTTYILHKFMSGWILTIILSVAFAFAYFLIFGWYVSLNESKSYKETFDARVKKDIEEYLARNGIDKQEFKLAAIEVLKSNSPLYPFLIEF
ncbi:MAG: zinc ribbon domain-containing protein [Leptospiraceae bacterium]|nr:zinc ribbon domain-containing protein [Leptospiraceae bacterium]MCP5502355.1 zinc ribbon domain-containing protein [Leptospiraceae bacterium]